MTTKLFIGVPGTGKTQAMMNFVQAQANEALFLVVDRQAEWTPTVDNQRWAGKPPKSMIVPGGYTFEQIEEMANELETGMLVFQYPWEGLQVAKIAVDLGNIVYVDDEIDLVAKYKDWDLNPLQGIVHRGRHLPNIYGEICENHILGACRRFQNLHQDITSLAAEIMVFRCRGKRTIGRLVEDGVLENEAEITAIRTLPNLHYYLYKESGELTPGSIKNPFSKKQQTQKQESKLASSSSKEPNSGQGD